MSQHLSHAKGWLAGLGLMGAACGVCCLPWLLPALPAALWSAKSLMVGAWAWPGMGSLLLMAAGWYLWRRRCLRCKPAATPAPGACDSNCRI